MTEAAGPERQPHVILCGLGHVGMRVLNLLVRLGENVHVITDRTRDEWRAAVERHASLIVGDARDERALRQAGIEQARAIVVATDNDLTNTSIAIDAKRINPSITVVMRLFDQQLAQSIESALGLRMALSASALAAPAFAAAAMGERSLGSFTLNDSLFVIEEHVIDAGRSVGACQPAHATAPAAVLRSGQIVAAAKPSAEMRQGDTLIALTEARAPRNREVAAMRPRDISDRLRGAAGGLRKTMVQISRPLRRALATLIAIVFASVIVFHFGLQLSFVDALYFVITTVTTTGYGDINLLNAPAAFKLYGAFLMICGASIMAVLFGIVTDAILTSRLRDWLLSSAALPDGHVIVAGMGNIGYRVVEELRRGGQGVLAIDRDRDGEFAELMRGRSPILLGDARSVLTLEKAGARKARAVVAALNDDLANLSIGLLVRREFPNVRTVLRLFDADLAAKLQAGLRFDAVLSMSAIAAATFVAAVMCPDAVYGFSVGDHLGLIVRRPAGASPASDAVAEANISAPLFCRAAGEARFHLSHAGCCAADGESLSLRWLPLTQPPII